jgi:hemolysin activation/secretion protein
VLDDNYSHGLGGRVGTVAVPLSAQGASADFDKFDASISVRQPLPAKLELDLTGRAQTSFNQPLLLAEQFSLDGDDALSSFADGSFSVDQGVSLRAELARPLAVQLGKDRPPAIFVPYLYGAYGHGQLVEPTAVQRARIDAGSAGLGVRSAVGPGVDGLPFGGFLAVEVGRQFSDLPGRRDGWRANVALNLTF